MKTILNEQHRALGAKLVEFCGWEMPIQYKGVIQEHMAVRQHVGIFDVSHMGRILVEGNDAEDILDYLSTNALKNKQDGNATYTVWCNEEGMCVDDLIVYRESSTRFFVIVNAGNREKDLNHIQSHAKDWDVKIIDRYKEDGIIAIQGPKAEELVISQFPEAKDVKPMHFMAVNYQGGRIILSRTGYTGAGGFEIYAPNNSIIKLWDLFLTKGEKEGIEPIGLGARDTLRLEKGYALYGHELSDKIAPNESVSGWTIKWDKGEFLGKRALEALQKHPSKRSEYGILLEDKGIAREGYAVFYEGKAIGSVTSGTFSPSLNRAIAIVLVEKKFKEGDSVEIQIRQNLCRGTITKLPFLH